MRRTREWRAWMLAALAACACDSVPSAEPHGSAEPASRTTAALSADTLTWVPKQQFQAINQYGTANSQQGVPGDGFGGCAAISGTVAAVSGYGFNQSGASWLQGAYAILGCPAAVAGGVIVNSDGTEYIENAGVWAYRFFTGSAPPVPISLRPAGADSTWGSAIAAGPSGVVMAGDPMANAVYVYQQPDPASHAVLVATLLGGAGEGFGTAVALSGSTLVVGAPGAGASIGAAYVYAQQPDATWKLQVSPLRNDGSIEAFAQAVAVSGDTIAIGAKGASSSRGAQGAVYVYARQPDGSFGAGQKIVPAGNDPGQAFGSSVSASEPYILVGAPNASAVSASQGAAYVLTQAGTAWTQQAIVAADGAANDAFGTAVAISGRSAIIGAPKTANGQVSKPGVAYFYLGLSVPGETCAADGDCLSGPCVHGVCCSSACTGVCQSCVTGVCAPVVNTQDPYLCSGAYTCNANAACVCANETRGGTCCAEACAGPCRTCAPSGACAAIVSADDPAGGCSGQRTCSATGVCGLRGGQPSTTAGDCASGFASDGFCCDAPCDAPCDVCAASLGSSADGVCHVAPAGSRGTPACSGGVVCDGKVATCSSAMCTSDASCVQGDYCGEGGVCVPQKAAGASCNLAAGADCLTSPCRECATGNCTDGVCCASAACSKCETCAGSLQAAGGASGTCRPALAGSDPHNDCPVDPAYPGDCGADGKCDGSGACRALSPANVACGQTACVADTVTGAVCDGKGTCAHTLGASCAPYACSSGQCASTCFADGDCTPDAYCSAAQTCEPRKGLGATCSSSVECMPVGLAPGQCVDGVCCDSVCEAQCRACDVDGAIGRCTLVKGSPHGKRASCSGDAPLCAGSCKGKVDGCTYPTGNVCSASCADALLTVASCEGTGHCFSAMPTPCLNNLRCASSSAPGESASACLTACAVDADCKSGSTCVSGGCVPLASTRCLDSHTAASPSAEGDGGISSCDPYLCDDKTGKCATSCASVRECASPAVCAVNGRCVAPPAPATPGGCTFEAFGPPASRATSWFVWAAFVLAHWRRGRGRTSSSTRTRLQGESGTAERRAASRNLVTPAGAAGRGQTRSA